MFRELSSGDIVLKEKLDAEALLRTMSIKTHGRVQILEAMESLINGYIALGIGRGWEHTWYRARKWESGERFENVRDLIYRVGGSKGYGRCSQPNQEIFYAGWNLPTALAEVRARVGDVVQVAVVRVAPWHELPCHTIGELQSLYHSGGSLLNARSSEIFWRTQMSRKQDVANDVFVDSVLANEFSRIVDDGNHEDYFLSSAVSARLMSSGGGLMYPSVASKQNINIAVTSDAFNKHFEVLGCFVLRVKQAVGYSLYAYEILDSSFSVASDGTFDWKSNQLIYREGPHGGAVHPDDMPSWRHAGFVKKARPVQEVRMPSWQVSLT